MTRPQRQDAELVTRELHLARDTFAVWKTSGPPRGIVGAAPFALVGIINSGKDSDQGEKGEK